MFDRTSSSDLVCQGVAAAIAMHIRATNTLSTTRVQGEM